MVDGGVEFCQEFFDDAVIPAENVVDKIDDGWTVASRLPFHERYAVGGSSPYLSAARLPADAKLEDLGRLAAG
jgi:alkylation response protein AidB-like acyl-CoA dehydrogenase